MARDIIAQCTALIAEHRRILLVFRKNGDGDSIASAVALASFLKKLGKDVDIVSDGYTPSAAFRFLSGADRIRPQPAHAQKFILSLDVKDVGVESLSYDVKNETLRIVVMPERGFLTRDRVRTAQSEFLYDLIIVLDSADLQSLGRVYEENTELFFTTPILNIDHHATNEHFGHVNIVDMTQSTTAEVLFRLFQEIGEEHIDGGIATALLTGIIAKTRSFKNEMTKPSTLEHASALIAHGAERETIVQHLFRTRSVAGLKLWGAALAHLKHDRERRLVWSTLTREDFARTGAAEHELIDVIDELISNSPEAELTILLHEHAENNTIHVLAKGSIRHSVKKLLRPFGPVGDDRLVSCEVPEKTLAEVETAVLDHVRATLAT